MAYLPTVPATVNASPETRHMLVYYISFQTNASLILDRLNNNQQHLGMTGKHVPLLACQKTQVVDV